VSVLGGHFVNGVFNLGKDVRPLIDTPPPDDSTTKSHATVRMAGQGPSVTHFITGMRISAGGSGQIEIWRTKDSGATWQGPAVVSHGHTRHNDNKTQNCGLRRLLQQSSAPAIGPVGKSMSRRLGQKKKKNLTVRELGRTPTSFFHARSMGA